MVSTFAQMVSTFGTTVDRYIFRDFSSARQLVMKRGVGKVRHTPRWKVAVDSGQKRLQYGASAKMSILNHLEAKEPDT